MAPHRVCLSTSDRVAATPSLDGVPCPRCGHRNRVGFANCARCRSVLFPLQPPGARGVGAFSLKVRHGEDMPTVAGYLRYHAYPIGRSPGYHWRRRRNELARQLRRQRREMHGE